MEIGTTLSCLNNTPHVQLIHARALTGQRSRDRPEIGELLAFGRSQIAQEVNYATGKRQTDKSQGRARRVAVSLLGERSQRSAHLSKKSNRQGQRLFGSSRSAECGRRSPAGSQRD